jgi:hypothetical protein
MIDLFAAALIAMSSLTPAPHHDVYAAEVGDDNANGVVEEDESGWSCVDDGNKICGPGNANGVLPGRYDGGGVLVDAWPLG